VIKRSENNRPSFRNDGIGILKYNAAQKTNKKGGD